MPSALWLLAFFGSPNFTPFAQCQPSNILVSRLQVAFTSEACRTLSSLSASLVFPSGLPKRRFDMPHERKEGLTRQETLYDAFSILQIFAVDLHQRAHGDRMSVEGFNVPYLPSKLTKLSNGPGCFTNVTLGEGDRRSWRGSLSV